ncbi:MAG: prepilin-type N-terminal cleavage/methylation domain-containing protein [Planctomycetota bacterium]|nr:prepilin-type N-terminal cleavage/methylation domain-containing protein [Planctomycetota bacterium]
MRKSLRSWSGRRGSGRAAFSLIELMVSLALLAIALLAFGGAISDLEHAAAALGGAARGRAGALHLPRGAARDVDRAGPRGAGVLDAHDPRARQRHAHADRLPRRAGAGRRREPGARLPRRHQRRRRHHRHERARGRGARPPDAALAHLDRRDPEHHGGPAVCLPVELLSRAAASRSSRC